MSRRPPKIVRVETTNKEVSLFSEVKKQLVTGIVGALLGVTGLVGFWLSPLKAVVMHRIYKESADLTARVSQRSPRVGDQIEVSVEIVPTSPIPVSEGVLQISWGNDGLTRKGGSSDSATAEIAAPVIVPKGERLILQATAPGHFTITAALKTKYRVYTAQTEIDVSPINQPTIGNLSGTWNITLGSALGKMELIHRGTDVSGIYRLTNPEIRGTITGFIDGSQFNVVLFNQGETRKKWFATALCRQGERFVEITNGTAQRQILENNAWTDAGKPGMFYAIPVTNR